MFERCDLAQLLRLAKLAIDCLTTNRQQTAGCVEDVLDCLERNAPVVEQMAAAAEAEK